MTYEEALRELEEAIKDKTFHDSAEFPYSEMIKTPEGREAFIKILNSVREYDRKRKEQKAASAALKAASQGTGGAA